MLNSDIPDIPVFLIMDIHVRNKKWVILPQYLA